MNLNTVGPWSTENPGSVSFLGKVYACSAVRRDGAEEVQGMLVYDEQSIKHGTVSGHAYPVDSSTGRFY